jgi:hypothetical protein
VTKLLERAVKKAKTLPDSAQDAIATLILEEIEDEARWDSTFSHSQNVLAKLAAEAMEEDRAGKTQVLDPDNL